MPYDDNNSYYIRPFLPNDKSLENAMNEHVMNQYPLSPEKKKMEGTVTPYDAKFDFRYIQRR